ncbi:MAG: PAS domain-containing protein, partial [Kovacikia sp.]
LTVSFYYLTLDAEATTRFRKRFRKRCLAESPSGFSKSPSLTVPGICFVTGGLLLLAFDWGVAAIAPDSVTRLHLQSLKSWIFLLAAVLVLYWCLRQSEQRFAKNLQDITANHSTLLIKYKRTEAALQESEELFHAFMNHSPVAAWIANAEGQMVYMSQTYARTFHLSQEDGIGKSIVDLYPPEIAQQFLRNISTVVETNQALKAIERALRLDGTLGEFLVYKFPLPGGGVSPPWRVGLRSTLPLTTRQNRSFDKTTSFLTSS